MTDNDDGLATMGTLEVLEEVAVALAGSEILVVETDERGGVHVQTETDDDRCSITDLVNLDNISAHNLYLGTELRRFATSSSVALSSDAESQGEEDADEGLNSEETSTAASSMMAGGSPKEEVNYAALDRFGFIVLGEDDVAGSNPKAIRKKCQSYMRGALLTRLVARRRTRRRPTGPPSGSPCSRPWRHLTATCETG